MNKKGSPGNKNAAILTYRISILNLSWSQWQMLTAKGFLTSKQVTHPLLESNGYISLSPLNLKAVKSLSRMAHTAMLVLEGVQSDFWSYLKKQLNLTFINWPAKLQSGNVTRPDQSHSCHQTPWPEMPLHVHKLVQKFLQKSTIHDWSCREEQYSPDCLLFQCGEGYPL